MDVVERPLLPPGCCVASLTPEDPDGFFDTGLSPAFVDPRVYVSVGWVRERARELGLVPGEALRAVEARVAELEEELRDADRLLEASEFTHTGFAKRQKLVEARA